MREFSKHKTIEESKDLKEGFIPYDNINMYLYETHVMLFQDGTGIALGSYIEYSQYTSIEDSAHLAWFILTPLET